MKFSLKIALLLFLSLSLQSCNLFSSWGVGSQGQPTKEVEGEFDSLPESTPVTIDYSDWDKLLKKHVNEQGLVDYKGFENDREELNLFLQRISSFEPTDDWSVQELLAYYINIYNAYTVDLILRNNPEKSIKDISGAWTNGIVPIKDRKLSLGGIENGVLRKMNEPRIHFAINCASISCPKLARDAYTADKIDEQLEEVTSEFINSNKNEISADKPKISSLFSFYPDDFTVNGKPDIIGFINRYSKTKINPDAKLEYKEYNWDLNKQ